MATCSSSGGGGKSAAKSVGGGTVAARSTATTKKTAEERRAERMADYSDRIEKATTREEIFRAVQLAERDPNITSEDYIKLDRAARSKTEALKYGKKSTGATSIFKSPFKSGSNPDNVAKFMTSDNVLRQKMTKLASDIKSGKEKNSVNTWKPLIQEATKKFTTKAGTKFGLYTAEQNMLAKALMEYYGI